MCGSGLRKEKQLHAQLVVTHWWWHKAKATLHVYIDSNAALGNIYTLDVPMGRLDVVSSQLHLTSVGRCVGQGRSSPLRSEADIMLRKGTKTGTALKINSLFKPPLSCEARGRNVHLPGPVER